LQLGRVDFVPAVGNEEKELVSFSPSQPREKWMKKRTSVKLKVKHTVYKKKKLKSESFKKYSQSPLL
jgi:hypothetical protein